MRKVGREGGEGEGIGRKGGTGVEGEEKRERGLGVFGCEKDKRGAGGVFIPFDSPPTLVSGFNSLLKNVNVEVCSFLCRSSIHNRSTT